MNKKTLGFWLVLHVALMGSGLSRVQAQSVEEWELYFEATGVNEILAQSDHLIEQEVRNLSNTPLGFSAEELADIVASFHIKLNPQQLKADMVAELNQRFSPQQKQSLSQLLNAQFLKRLQLLESNLQDEAVRQSMRSYQMKLKSFSPRAARVELLAELDQSLQQSQLETELKVELRKHLLAVVSKMKSDEAIPETLLDQQLTSYRSNVEGEISENALHAYLYLLKRVPSSQLRDWLLTLNAPVYSKFMSICHESLRMSFRHAREELLSEARLAGN